MQQRSADLQLRRSADHAACRAAIRQGSKSFFAASLLLPGAVSEPAFALYAFCRLADDAVDGEDRCDRPVEGLRERLDRVYAGYPRPVPADRAFAEVVTRFALPRALPDALLDGLAWDDRGRVYETLPELRAYAVRVAGTVGMMMTLLMGRREPATLARACDLGIAMQLTNIARDVGEDARNGRLYLPRQWLMEAGIDPERWLVDPTFSPALGSVIERLLVTADEHYERALSGIAGLPRGCRPAIHAARLVYREIGEVLRRRGLNSVAQRAVVAQRRKFWLLGRASLNALYAGGGETAQIVPEARFLLDAVRATPAPAVVKPRLDDQIGWVIELFGRLERDERALREELSTSQRLRAGGLVG
ncbi:MAG: phytoene/squalene synthase family protein [Geminicoccaceae bacterium]